MQVVQSSLWKMLSCSQTAAISCKPKNSWTGDAILIRCLIVINVYKTAIGPWRSKAFQVGCCTIAIESADTLQMYRRGKSSCQRSVHRFYRLLLKLIFEFKHLEEKTRVGIDPTLISAGMWHSATFHATSSTYSISSGDAGSLKKSLASRQSELISLPVNLVDVVWGSDRPPKPKCKIFPLDIKFAG